VADGKIEAGDGDAAHWFGPKHLARLAAGGAAWDAFAGEAWSRGGAPAGFVAAHFGTLAAALDQAPLELMNKKMRRSLKNWREVARGLTLALGGACLRLDAEGERWVLRLRTLRTAGATGGP
jgi:hypothetical protein